MNRFIARINGLYYHLVQKLDIGFDDETIGVWVESNIDISDEIIRSSKELCLFFSIGEYCRKRFTVAKQIG